MSERVFNLLAVELQAVEGTPDGRRFAARGLARELGAERTGLSIYEVEPGHATWPYHFELNEEEWLLVIDGELTLRTPDGEQQLRAGDVACFVPGVTGAHAVRNDGEATARFAMPSSVAPHGGGCVYPDAGTFVLYGPGFSHRGKLGDPLEYWEGQS